ncbi:carboxymuconolactone decarboxylase family protein [Roseivivax jejudonensis]|uniref:carboxymuconolactone decarboxylase family protein n=1 Tax=Roseivivax jejudonensis TaxID=1529041 RepID=UPI000A26B68D|nr:carboxymuconolactone decarboxylase family protein [Roseivivax jejudonensis]
MPLVPPLAPEALPEDLRDQVRFFEGTLGGVPNSILTMSRRPEIARAYTELNRAVMAEYGDVTPEFKRLIGYVASFASGCLYCQAHMILASERFGASEDRLNNVWSYEDSPHFSEAEKAALAFAQCAATVPNAVDGDVAARLREHWGPDDVVEIMSVVALFGFLNRWNDSMGTSLEEMPIDRGTRRLAETTGWHVGKHRDG